MEIFPSDQIFPYIIFKGSDIKDLYVISGPKEMIPPAFPSYNLPPGMNPYYAQQAMAYHQQQQQQYWQQHQLLDPMMMNPNLNPYPSMVFLLFKSSLESYRCSSFYECIIKSYYYYYSDELFSFFKREF